MTPPAATSRTVFISAVSLAESEFEGRDDRRPMTKAARSSVGRRSGGADGSARRRAGRVARQRDGATEPDGEANADVDRERTVGGEVFLVKQLHRAVELADHPVGRLAGGGSLVLRHPHLGEIDHSPARASDPEAEVEVFAVHEEPLV